MFLFTIVRLVICKEELNQSPRESFHLKYFAKTLIPAFPFAEYLSWMAVDNSQIRFLEARNQSHSQGSWFQVKYFAKTLNVPFPFKLFAKSVEYNTRLQQSDRFSAKEKLVRFSESDFIWNLLLNP